MIIHEPQDLAPLIDHTLLRPEATQAEIDQLCREALTYSFAAVCANPVFVPFVRDRLAASPVKVCTVIAFPLGASATPVKVEEAIQAVSEGAQELDMVIQLGALRERRFRAVEEDIRAVVSAVPVTVKVILEICLWNEEQIRTACQLAMQAGARFVKTSTGFSSGGATVEAVRIMKEAVGERLGIKAAGGIRDFTLAKALVEAGATRIGASASLKIIGAV